MAKTGNDYYKLFKEARAKEANRFDEYRELAAFYEGEQNLLTQYQLEKPWVIDLNTPYASDAIDLRVASLQASDYVGELEPLSPEDVEMVDKINAAYHNFWKEMQMDDVINESIERAAVLREAYVHIVFDDEEVVGGSGKYRLGALKPYFVDQAAVLIDPSATKFKDADYLIVTERISKQKIKREYKSFFDDDMSEEVGSPFTPQDRGEIYVGKDFTTNQEDVHMKWTIYEKTEEGMEKTVLVDNKIVEETDDFAIGIFPIAQLRWQSKYNSPYGISLMDKLLSLQKSVNSIESAVTNTALQFAAPSFAVSLQSGIDPQELSQVMGAPGLVLGVNGNPADAVHQLISNALDASMLEVKRENEQAIYKISGATEEFQGNLGSSGNTSGGSDMAVRRAKIIEQKFLSNLELFVQDATKIIVTFITKVFAGEILTVRSERKTDGSFDFNDMEVPEGSENLDYTFYVNLDVKTPYSKEKNKQLLQELYQMEMQYDSPVKTINILDILKTYDLPNKQELIERYKNLTTKDEQTKAQTIAQFVSVAEEAGVDLNLITQGILEINLGKDTPTVDQVIQMIQQQRQQQEQAMQQADQQRVGAQQQAEKQLMQQEFQQAQQMQAQQQQQAPEGQQQLPITQQEIKVSGGE